MVKCLEALFLGSEGKVMYRVLWSPGGSIVPGVILGVWLFCTFGIEWRATPHREQQFQRPGLAFMARLQCPSSKHSKRGAGETNYRVEQRNGSDNCSGDRKHWLKGSQRVIPHQTLHTVSDKFFSFLDLVIYSIDSHLFTFSQDLSSGIVESSRISFHVIWNLDNHILPPEESAAIKGFLLNLILFPESELWWKFTLVLLLFYCRKILVRIRPQVSGVKDGRQSLHVLPWPERRPTNPELSPFPTYSSHE